MYDGDSSKKFNFGLLGWFPCLPVPDLLSQADEPISCALLFLNDLCFSFPAHKYPCFADNFIFLHLICLEQHPVDQCRREVPRMERLIIALTPALRSDCSARLMPKRRMCSGGGVDVSRGKEAGGDSGSFSQNKIWKPTLFMLGGAAVGLYLYNSNAATKEKNVRRGREEATERHNREMERHKSDTERHNREMERYKREHEAYKRESKIYDHIHKLQMT